jgi:hypothetical protein
MKAIPYVLLLPLALIALFTQCEKEPEIRPDDPVDIPDRAFKIALIKERVDTNGDRYISYGEAEAVTRLDVYDRSIYDMTGIEAFVNLEYLECGINQLTNLDVTKNTALISLYCHSNQLTSLNLLNNTALKGLTCSENQLTNLDVSSNTELRWLYCQSNQLANLDVSNCTALFEIWCQSNQLASLDITTNGGLRTLICTKNQLTRLNISNNIQLKELDMRYMPTLEEICVWTMPFPPEGYYVSMEGSPNVYFTTECSK